jgi:hypothetical protein
VEDGVAAVGGVGGVGGVGTVGGVGGVGGVGDVRVCAHAGTAVINVAINISKVVRFMIESPRETLSQNVGC